MWHLNYIDSDKEQEYLKLLFDKVKEKRDAITISSIKRYLTNKKLEELIISKPSELNSKTEEYIRRIFPANEYNTWIAAAKKKINSRTRQQQDLIAKYESVIDVFDYKRFIVNDKEVSYSIASIIGVNTCVYCNRQYIFTVDDENNGHITRPEFDHYLPKSTYPFFALSLYNLIPSCHICNSNCKGTTLLDNNMNPYLTEKEDYFKFTYHIKENGMPASVQIKDIKNGDVNKFLDTFKIQDIYDAHTNFELTELHTFATKYSNTYLQEVLSKIGLDLRLSQEDAYRILFGTELFEDKDNDRPLSKFKRDILEELGVITGQH